MMKKWFSNIEQYTYEQYISKVHIFLLMEVQVSFLVTGNKTGFDRLVMSGNWKSKEKFMLE